jgi:hypothetical protein
MLAIWSTGFIATELDVDYDDLPIFLVDCRTRSGQSGSAVIAFRTVGFVRLMDGSMHNLTAAVCKLLGIYSGRIKKDSDLGMVWKAEAIQQLINSVK